MRTDFAGVGSMGWDEDLVMPGISFGKYTPPAYLPNDEEVPIHDACLAAGGLPEGGYYWV